MDTPTPPALLIADPDLDFLQSLKMDPQARANPPLVTHDEDAALRIISDLGIPLAAVFVSPGLAAPFGIPVIQHSLKSRPDVPVFYLLDPGFDGLTPKEIQGLGIRKSLQKPVRYSQLPKAVQELQLAFDPKEALARAATHAGEQLEQEALASDGDFLPISAAGFVSGSSSYFDIYVRLKPGKYVKILQAGDAFSPERVASYRKKGVENFYLRKDAQEAYLKYCDQLATAAVKKASIAPELKLSVAANQGEQVSSFLKQRGIDAAGLLHAEKFIGNVHELSRQMGFHRNEIVAKYLKDLAKSEHGVGVTMLTSFMIQPLHYAADKSVTIIGMASLMHDVGLAEMDAKLAAEDEESLSEAERAAYRTHPEKGAAILAELKLIDPTVIQAVRQHHERRTRNGFPHRIGAGALNQVSEIIGICDEFFRIIQAVSGPNPVDFNQRMESAIYREFSAPIVEAFRASFKL